MNDNDVWEILADADELPYGPARIARTEEAVALADVLGDLDLAYTARVDLLQACEFGGATDKALVAFTWLLGRSDAEPDEYPEDQILWQYKWIAVGLPQLVAVRREQIEGALDDMEHRFTRGGSGPVPVSKVRWRVAKTMGDLDRAAEIFERWRRLPRKRGRAEYLSDCEACDVSESVEMLATLGRDAEALEIAKPVLAGNLSCAEVPHCTYASVLLPMLRQGRDGEARHAHLEGYRLIRDNPDFLDSIGEHLTFLALTENHVRGLGLFEQHAAWFARSRDDLYRFEFLLGARLVLREAMRQGQEAVVLLLPPGIGPPEPTGTYQVAHLAAWADASLRELASAFDARNGNRAFSDRIETSTGWEGFRRPVALGSAW